MNTIDPQTGLQALPENMFWKVLKESYVYKGQNLYRMALMYTSYKKVKRLKWYGKPYTKTVATHTELHREPIWNSDSERGTRLEVGYAAIITPAHLRNASVRALDTYEKQLAEASRLAEQEDNSAEFLGDYPPKSIIGKENE